MLRRSLFGILFFYCLSASGQSTPAVSAGVLPAYLIAHRADIKNLESHVTGLELSLDRIQLKGDWCAYYSKPLSGLQLAYFDLGKEESGFALGVLPHISVQLLQVGAFSLRYRAGAGLAYLSKRYDPLNNRRNLAIGSHMNAYVQTALYAAHDLKRSRLELGVALSHFSNSALEAPNLGFNIPSLSLRYAWYGSDRIKYSEAIRDTGHQRHWAWSVGGAVGSKERSISNPIRFMPFGAMVRAKYRVNPVRSWRMGLDLISDKIYAFLNNNDADLSQVPLSERLEWGMALGHEWHMGRLRVLLEGGVYVHKPYDFNKPTYQRMGFEYRVHGPWILHSTLKFHRGVADYLAWGLTYQWNEN